MSDIENALAEFSKMRRFRGKGPLSVALHITRLARRNGLPLDSETLLAKSGTQVAGLSGGNVRAVLKDYAIDERFAAEGGRTSRGSVENMRHYVAFLNELHSRALLTDEELAHIESWWIARVREFLAAKPIRLKFDPSKSLQAIISDLIQQALRREKDRQGTRVAGPMLQHLIGAKLEVALPDVKIEHHGASVADESSERQGDFVVDHVVLHTTMAPSEALARKCEENLNSGFRPIIVTIGRRVAGAQSLLSSAGIEGRVDVFDIEQFISMNVYEWSRFIDAERAVSVRELVNRYNRIIDDYEMDPSLKVEVVK